LLGRGERRRNEVGSRPINIKRKRLAIT